MTEYIKSCKGKTLKATTERIMNLHYQTIAKSKEYIIVFISCKKNYTCRSVLLNLRDWLKWEQWGNSNYPESWEPFPSSNHMCALYQHTTQKVYHSTNLNFCACVCLELTSRPLVCERMLHMRGGSYNLPQRAIIRSCAATSEEQGFG